VSSNEGDLVLDPFSGCGTTVEAAERLGRRWIGIDVSPRAVEIIKDRLDAKYEPRVWAEPHAPRTPSKGRGPEPGPAKRRPPQLPERVTAGGCGDASSMPSGATTSRFS
jgi:hypothetical protein